LFILYNLILSLKKNYIIYPNIELLNFYINILALTITIKRLKAFRKLIFPEIFKILEMYIGSLGFIRYLISYYSKILELF
ncbi:hypothetical protein QBC45DRAFT_334785, partial [Copromyces sp. CBS 386.78]